MSYTIAPSLQQVFCSKETSLPASGGKVWFYRDVDRTTIKPVFKNTGSPGSPVYVQYELNTDNSISLNSSGSPEHFIYYYPYDETGSLDLYYCVAQDAEGNQIMAEGNYPAISNNNSSNQIIYFIGTMCPEPDIEAEDSLAEAITEAVEIADYYTDSGSANAYVANVPAGYDTALPCELKNGMRIRLLPNHTNTGPSTLTFTTQQGTTTNPILHPITGEALSAGDMDGATSNYQPTAELEYVPGQGWFLMANAKSTAPVFSGMVYASDTDPDNPDTLIKKIWPTDPVDYDASCGIVFDGVLFGDGPGSGVGAVTACNYVFYTEQGQSSSNSRFSSDPGSGQPYFAFTITPPQPPALDPTKYAALIEVSMPCCTNIVGGYAFAGTYGARLIINNSIQNTAWFVANSPEPESHNIYLSCYHVFEDSNDLDVSVNIGVFDPPTGVNSIQICTPTTFSPSDRIVSTVKVTKTTFKP